MRLSPTHAVTLAWNRAGSWNPRQAESLLRRDLRFLLAKLDKRLLGPRFYRKPSAARIEGLFVFEKLGTNPHAHALIRLPETRFPAAQFPELIAQTWQSVAPTGSAIIAHPHSAGFAGYITKDQNPNSGWLVASEFHGS